MAILVAPRVVLAWGIVRVLGRHRALRALMVALVALAVLVAVLGPWGWLVAVVLIGRRRCRAAPRRIVVAGRAAS